jgi:NAD(P)-dependent dehydrogenase (short-subunit alcohol dehydrogenase family)
VAQLGGLNIVVANAGITTIQPWDEVTPAIWQTTLDICLTGVWHTCAVSIPHLIDGGGGSIVITSSVGGVKGLPFILPYVAAKHGVQGIMRALANELSGHRIRVNTVHPTGVTTNISGEVGFARLKALIANHPNIGPMFMNALPVELVEPEDVAHAVVYLASDEARYVTGMEFKVDAGTINR